MSFGHNVAHFMPPENNLVMVLWNAMKILRYVTAIMRLQYDAFIFVLLLLFFLQRCSDWMHCIAEELKSSVHWILQELVSLIQCNRLIGSVFQMNFIRTLYFRGTRSNAQYFIWTRVHCVEEELVSLPNNETYLKRTTHGIISTTSRDLESSSAYSGQNRIINSLYFRKTTII